MLRMNTLGDAGTTVSRMNGWEISGIVFALILIAVGAWMTPEFVRYMKIRHM